MLCRSLPQGSWLGSVGPAEGRASPGESDLGPPSKRLGRPLTCRIGCIQEIGSLPRFASFPSNTHPGRWKGILSPFPFSLRPRFKTPSTPLARNRARTILLSFDRPDAFEPSAMTSLHELLTG